MNYDLLQVLVCVAESKNFREAAESLGVSQASITNKLAQLESNYPSPLFVVEGKKKVLTPFGKGLVEASKKNFFNFELSLKEVERRFIENQSVPLKVGARPEVFSFISKHLPNELTYQFIPMTGPAVAPAILNGEIDFGFTSVVPDSLQLLAKQAFKSSVQLVVHKSLVPNKIQKPLWKNIDFLTQTASLSYGVDGHLLTDLCRFHSLDYTKINVRIIADSWTILKELVSAERGYAVIPSYISLGSDIFIEPIPVSVSKPINFHLLVRTAYKNVSIFKNLLSIQWLQVTTN